MCHPSNSNFAPWETIPQLRELQNLLNSAAMVHVMLMECYIVDSFPDQRLVSPRARELEKMQLNANRMFRLPSSNHHPDFY